MKALLLYIVTVMLLKVVRRKAAAPPQPPTLISRFIKFYLFVHGSCIQKFIDGRRLSGARAIRISAMSRAAYLRSARTLTHNNMYKESVARRSFWAISPRAHWCFIVSFVLPTATVLNDSCPPAYLISLSASRSNLAVEEKIGSR
jgi:hypothetical protein